jgi:uncharacterized membrane protein YhiD involved in acid resistance
MYKTTAVFLLKSLAFTLVFFAVSTVVAHLRDAFANRSDQTECARTQQSSSYERQLAESAAQLAKSSGHQQRMEALISTQEAQIKRYEGVLQQWEKQTGLRK